MYRHLTLFFPEKLTVKYDNNNNNNNNNLFTYNAQVSIYILTCAELNSLKKTNYRYII